ncbi:hypothetical protein ACFSJU_02115 [Paradesertivirga mongoliensis]|uniref:Uncharacterized protein n=1 Tax=Paradesertivirga mongoliensis TaxID=2100740 RepID=A0ABW4ZGV7_9SPHI|nr:hypothetical protein [Pedobacter mongoliensis]
MENPIETYNKSKNSENANNPAHYTLMAIGVFVTVLGAVLRFIAPWTFVDMLSNIILVIGVIICLKAVLAILK